MLSIIKQEKHRSRRPGSAGSLTLEQRCWARAKRTASSTSKINDECQKDKGHKKWMEARLQYKQTTLRKASSWSPLSTESMVSTLPSPAVTVKSWTSLSASSRPSLPVSQYYKEQFNYFRPLFWAVNGLSDNLPLWSDPFLALCPADVTYSKGRGASEDQYSCFDMEISG